MDHAERTRWTRFTPTETRGGRLHAALRDPVRGTLVAAAILLVLGSFAGWIEVWLPYRGWFEISSFERASDGGITLELGLAVFALGWSERVSSSRLAVLVAAPLVLGVFALLDLKVAGDAARLYLDSIAQSGGHGYLLPGYWATVGGATLVALAGLVKVWRSRREVNWTVGLKRGTAITIAGGIIGAFLGFYAGVTFGQRITSGGIAGVTGSVMILFAIGFGFAGAWLGAAAGHWFGATQNS